MIFLATFALLAAASAAPATYDQRQDGEFNVRADVQNVVLLVAYPQKMGIPPGFLDGLLKNTKQNRNEPQLQDRADVQVMEAFVEPSTPYHVEIGDANSYSEGDGRAVEIVIAGRRRLGNPDNQINSELDNKTEDEYKLIGATEQCGPDRERDPVTLGCRARSQPVETEPESTPAQPAEPVESPQPAPEVKIS